jgi:prevent-host-death family protein
MIETKPDATFEAADTQSLADFRERSTEILQRLKSTHRPITLTVDGRPEAILQEPAEYQRLLSLAAIAEEDEAIRQGLEDMEAGRTQPLNEVFDELRAKYAIPR